MDLTTIQAIFSAVTTIVNFVIKYGPGLVQDVENIVADLQLAWQSATSGTTITSAQQAQIDAALSAANTALQAAITAQQAQG